MVGAPGSVLEWKEQRESQSHDDHVRDQQREEERASQQVENGAAHGRRGPGMDSGYDRSVRTGRAKEGPNDAAGKFSRSIGSKVPLRAPTSPGIHPIRDTPR